MDTLGGYIATIVVSLLIGFRAVPSAALKTTMLVSAQFLL